MITDNLEQFLDTIMDKLNSIGVDVSGMEMDHFGYQTCSEDDYETRKAEGKEEGELVSENIVNGRRVAIFRFYKPISYRQFVISGFELVEPKEGQFCDSSLEHVEFVSKKSFEELLKENSQVNWDVSAINRTEFAKLAIRFEDNTGVKFHLKNIFEEIPVKQN